MDCLIQCFILIGLSNKDVELVNVNWSLSPSLLTGQVDAVIGVFRNFELNQLALEKQEGIAFFPEQYGVPAYDELILVANKNSITDKKTSAFLTALEQATSYLQAHPNEAWQAFVSYKPNVICPQKVGQLVNLNIELGIALGSILLNQV